MTFQFRQAIVSLQHTAHKGLQMRLLLALLLLTSCAHQQSKQHLKKPNKYSYLQEFYKNRDKLKLETKSCKNYMENRFRPLMKTDQIGKVSVVNLKDAASSYTPELFDWDTKTQIGELYLTYEYSYEIVNEHFEIFNNIKDCMNELDHMTFIKAVITSFISDPESAKKIFNKYFEYSRKSNLSPLNVLILSSLTLEMENNKILSLKDKLKFIEKKQSLEKNFSHSGKELLSFFRNKNYQEVYKLASKLKAEKANFQKYIHKSIIFK